MVYFIRARTHYQYALRLWQELREGKRTPDRSLLKEIYLQGLKALYAVTEISPPEKSLTVDEIIAKILPTLSESEKKIILTLREVLFSEDLRAKELPLEEVNQFLETVRQCLSPVL